MKFNIIEFLIDSLNSVKKKNYQMEKIRHNVDQSLFYCMLINPSSYNILSQFLSYSIPEFHL